MKRELDNNILLVTALKQLIYSKKDFLMKIKQALSGLWMLKCYLC